jgi:hypothetical protein
MNLAHLLTNAARSFPERPAVLSAIIASTTTQRMARSLPGSAALSATASVFTQATASRSL